MKTYSTSTNLFVHCYAFAASEGRFVGQAHVQGPIEGGNLDLHFTCDMVDPTEGDAVVRALEWAERRYPRG